MRSGREPLAAERVAILDRIHRELANLAAMGPHPSDERGRRLGISDWIAEEVIVMSLEQDPHIHDLERQSGCDDPDTSAVEYQPMSDQELHDLSLEVGRKLTEPEAQEYRLRTRCCEEHCGMPRCS